MSQQRTVELRAPGPEWCHRAWGEVKRVKARSGSEALEPPPDEPMIQSKRCFPLSAFNIGSFSLISFEKQGVGAFL